jgi:hypothetical protein
MPLQGEKKIGKKEKGEEKPKRNILFDLFFIIIKIFEPYPRIGVLQNCVSDMYCIRYPYPLQGEKR